MKKYIFSMAVIAVLYGVNRMVLIPATMGTLHDMLVWYGADFLAGALMLCILNILLLAAKRSPLRRFWSVTAFLLCCGLFWEVVTPLYLPRSVGDPLDVLVCCLGGITMWLIQRKKPSV